MQYRTLGRTGLSVSEVGYGGAPIGIPNYNEVWDPAGERETASVVAAVRRAVEVGINYFDTAPGYGHGRSEELLGQALEGQRGQVVVATKTPWKKRSREWIVDGVEASLRRLRTDHVDVLQLHGGFNYSADDVKWILEGGVMDAFQRLKAQGKVRYFGLTAGEHGSLGPLLDSELFDVVQIKYNVLYQEPYHAFLPTAKKRGVGVVLMRPLTSGIFQRLMRTARPDIDDLVDLNRLALNYVLSDPNVAVAICGMRRASEVESNNAVSDAVHERIDLEWLHERAVPAATAAPASAPASPTQLERVK